MIPLIALGMAAVVFILIIVFVVLPAMKSEPIIEMQADEPKLPEWEMELVLATTSDGLLKANPNVWTLKNNVSGLRYIVVANDNGITIAPFTSDLPKPYRRYHGCGPY
jgi:hypothetical protein